MATITHSRKLQYVAWALLFLLIGGYALLGVWSTSMRATLDDVTSRMEHEGESLNIRAWLSPPIPDEENFCALPALAGLAPLGDDSPADEAARQKRQRLDTIFKQPTLEPRPFKSSNPKYPGGCVSGVPGDMLIYLTSYARKGATPAKDASGEYAQLCPLQEEFLQEITPGLSRPRAQWTPALSTRPLPEPLELLRTGHLKLGLQMGEALGLRGLAAAQSGDAPKAVESWQITARLQEAAADESLLGYLLEVHFFHDKMMAISWELAWARQGTALQWREMEQGYSHTDLRAWVLRTYRYSRAQGVATTIFLKGHRDPDLVSALQADIPSFPDLPSWTNFSTYKFRVQAMPNATFDYDAITIARLTTEAFIAPLRDGTWRQTLDADPGFEIDRHQGVIATRLLATLSRLPEKFICWQGQLSLVTVACRLEGWQREHGEYPESLTGLTLSDGQPLPLDPMNGQALGYRRTSDGRYALWSVAFDGVDDGGRRGAIDQMSAKGYRGDWVWDFQGN